jgi:hypothetical protein
MLCSSLAAYRWSGALHWGEAGSLTAARHSARRSACMPAARCSCMRTQVASDAVAEARSICFREYGSAPVVTVHGNPALTMAYVPSHLHHMVFELVKNSLRAVQERYQVRGPGGEGAQLHACCCMQGQAPRGAAWPPTMDAACPSSPHAALHRLLLLPGSMGGGLHDKGTRST